MYSRISFKATSLPKQHSHNETNGTLNATVSLKAFWHSTADKDSIHFRCWSGLFPLQKSPWTARKKTSGPMENPRNPWNKKSMARIKNPNGSSIQKEKKSSPDLPEDRRPVPLPRSVSMRPLSGRKKTGWEFKGSGQGFISGAQIWWKFVLMKTTQQKNKNKTSLPETNMFPLLIRPSDPSFNHPFFREATPKTHKIRPHCTSPSFSRNFWGSSLIGIKASWKLAKLVCFRHKKHHETLWRAGNNI